MNITEYNIENLTLLLETGERPRIGDIELFKTSDKNLTVTGWTNYSHVDNISENIARQELSEIKALFVKLADISPDFKQYLVKMTVTFELSIDIYKAGFLVCSLINDKFIWGDIKK